MVKTAAKVTCLTYAEYHCGAILDTSEWRVVDVCAGLLLAASTKNKYVYISLLNFSILLYLIIGVKIGFFSALVGSFFLAALKRMDYFSILHLYSASLLPRVSLGRSFNGDVLTKNSSFLGENIDHISCLFYIVSPVRHHQLYYNLRQVMKWRMKRR